MKRPLFLILLLAFVLLLATCSKSPTDLGANLKTKEYVFHTPLIDYAHGATLLPNGDFLVYGFAEGQIGYGDWVNAYPLLLFMHADGSVADTVIYRNIKYGEIIGAAPFANGVAVLVDSVLRVRGAEPNSLKIHRLQADHSLGEVIYSLADSMNVFFTPPQPLAPAANNGLILILSRNIRTDDLTKISAAGEIEWTYRLPDVQHRVKSVAQTGEGDILVLGVRTPPQFEVVKLNADGQVQWQKSYWDTEGVGSVFAIAALQSGAAVLVHRFHINVTN